MAAAAILKNDMVVVGIIFSHYFLILMDRAYSWGVLPSIDGYFFQFEIIINVLVSSFWFIWIPMLWVYDH